MGGGGGVGGIGCSLLVWGATQVYAMIVYYALVDYRTTRHRRITSFRNLT